MEESRFNAGDVVAGKYEVERVLGEGGMGVVIAARHLELDQRVAVKFLLPEIAKRADAAERFRREARAAVKIRSEHVARVMDVGTTEEGVPFMVMEYLEGADLGWELRHHGQFAVTDAVTYMLEACEAVAEAHAAGIVHRDLKPANLFLARRADGSRLVKVLDFGISKSVTGGSLSDLSLTNTSALIGSPLYMSPEQMHSAKSVDARTDIWALGAILYQTIANRPPYVGETIPQLCSSLLNDTPPPLSSFRNDVPAELETVLGKALEKDRDKRFKTVADFANALVPFAPGSRIHAERASRVLGVSDAQGNLSTSSSPRVVAHTAAETPDALGEQPTIASEPPGKPGERTLASWGKTGDASRSEPAPGKKRRGLAFAVGAVALVAAGAIWMATRAPARAGSEPAARPTAAEPTPPPTHVEAQPAPALPAPPTAEASTEANADAAVKPEVTPTARPGSPRTAPPKHSPGPSNPKTSVPDFGGRR